MEDLELGTLSWVHWFNHQRLHTKIGYIPPTEYEDEYYRRMHAHRQSRSLRPVASLIRSTHACHQP